MILIVLAVIAAAGFFISAGLNMMQWKDRKALASDITIQTMVLPQYLALKMSRVRRMEYIEAIINTGALVAFGLVIGIQFLVR